MMKLLELRAGALTITDGGSRGLMVEAGGLDGWDAGAVMRSNTQPRPQAHGDFDMPGFLAGRLVALTGLCLVDHPDELENFRDRVVGHGADGTKFMVVGERNGRSLRAVARLGAGQRTNWTDLGRGTEARWEMSWWFPDPRRYGDIASFGPASSVQVIHRGNFPALPTLHVTGASGGGYTISGHGGRLIVITRPLVAGVPHRFDMRTGRLYVGGARVLGGVARADLFTVPPGLPVSTISISAGQLRVEVEDTYI